MDDIINNEIEKKKNLHACNADGSLENRASWVQTQSPQLRESEPTFWILNAVLGIRVAPPPISGRAY